jgi:hypothetical protein
MIQRYSAPQYNAIAGLLFYRVTFLYAAPFGFFFFFDVQKGIADFVMLWPNVRFQKKCETRTN